MRLCQIQVLKERLPSVNFRLRAIDIKKKESEILYTQNTNLKVTAKN